MNNKMTTAAAVAMLVLLPSFAIAAEPAAAEDRIPQEILKTIPSKSFMAPGKCERSLLSVLQHPDMANFREIPASILNQLKPSDFKLR